jgi:hypothetical protein
MRQFRRWPSAGTKLATSCEEELTSDTYNSMGANQELQQIRASDTTYKLHAENAGTRGRTGDLQIFGLTLSQLSYRG